MKRKKPPIALISVLVIAFLGLVIYSKNFSFYNLSAADQQTQIQQDMEARARAQSQSASSQPKLDAGKEVGAMQAAMKNTKNVKKDIVSEGEVPHQSVPSVIMPDTAVHKPVKNTSSTSSQWYDGK